MGASKTRFLGGGRMKAGKKRQWGAVLSRYCGCGSCMAFPDSIGGGCGDGGLKAGCRRLGSRGGGRNRRRVRDRVSPAARFFLQIMWNTPIDTLKKDKHSEDYIQRMGPALPLHPNFGSEAANGIPITIIKPGRPRIPITFTYGDESDPGHYPTPEGALVEGGWNSPKIRTGTF